MGVYDRDENKSAGDMGTWADLQLLLPQWEARCLDGSNPCLSISWKQRSSAATKAPQPTQVSHVGLFELFKGITGVTQFCTHIGLGLFSCTCEDFFWSVFCVYCQTLKWNWLVSQSPMFSRFRLTHYILRLLSRGNITSMSIEDFYIIYPSLGLYCNAVFKEMDLKQGTKHYHKI